MRFRATWVHLYDLSILAIEIGEVNPRVFRVRTTVFPTPHEAPAVRMLLDFPAADWILFSGSFGSFFFWRFCFGCGYEKWCRNDFYNQKRSQAQPLAASSSRIRRCRDSEAGRSKWSTSRSLRALEVDWWARHWRLGDGKTATVGVTALRPLRKVGGMIGEVVRLLARNQSG